MNTFESVRCNRIEPAQFLDLGKIYEALKVKVLFQLKRLVERKQNKKKTQKDFVNSDSALDIVRATNDHIKLITFVEFMN